MKYLCLVYGEEANFKALSKHESDSLISDSMAYDEALRKSGHYIVSDVLESVRTATTVRRRKGKVSVTDGPFAETKEQLLGFILIDAKDRDDAIRVASEIPCGRIGSVEVRPSRRSGQRVGRRLPLSNGIDFGFIMPAMRGSFMTLAFTRSRSLRDL